MRASDTSEKGLETIIEKHLVEQNGYVRGHGADYDRELCIDKKLLFEFLEATQPDVCKAIDKRGRDRFLKRLSGQIGQEGVIEVLRNGIRHLDLAVRLYCKKPGSGLNETAKKNYGANIFSVTRQLRYSLENSNSLDMAVSINGLPLVTFELKNQWTGQYVKNAIKQYKGRSPKEKLFGFGRCMVHFAADDELVYMATRLSGDKTLFLPFNKGSNGGAGNRVNPNGLKTDYLWKEILAKESLGNILENYAQILEEKDEDTGKAGKRLIFPRYHQLDAVEGLIAHAKAHGAGRRYLIQHSAGSGKSNSIAWLALKLVSLHGPENKDTVFDSVIVVTDRRVLDRQIRDNIKQFARVNKVVEAIEKGSRQLKQALEDGKKIIITTVQKFPFIIDEIGTLGAKRFAILIDEAHSSQSGETAGKMNWILAEEAGEYRSSRDRTDAGEAQDPEDVINRVVEQRRMIKNGSYFAFTATPKNKTLETFGVKQPDGKFKPFHAYTMKQAIEEEFILDVLKNYTAYRSYYRINKAAEGNPEYETRQANKKIRNYVESHPFSIKEKTEVMIGHFHAEISGRINGRAKSMVVCKDIKNAIRYYQAFKEYLQKINSPFKAIVAFSGTKEIDGLEWDEAGLNGFPGADIPKEFKKEEYRFLIVADKFQTGFDQPLLHTMYIDKKMRDVQAVQALSRLNRAYKPYKEDTFVMDFFNTAEDIQEAFGPFYATTILSEGTDPNKLNDLRDALDRFQVYGQDDVHKFTDLYFKEADRQELDPIIDKCASAHKDELSEEERIDFYVKAKSFFRIYAFLSKILTFKNAYWERLYWFLKFLIPKIKPEGSENLAKGILESIDLDSYRLARAARQDIKPGGEEELGPLPATMKGNKQQSAFDSLGAIIKEFNKRFGIDNWTDNDKVKQYLFEQLPADFAKDEETVGTVRNSDRQNAKIASDKKVEGLIQDVVFTYTDLYKKFTDDPEFKRSYLDFVFKKIWESPTKSARGL